MTRSNLVFKNTVMFLIGFCVYITIEVLFRGYSFPLMGCLGGVAFILIDKINDYISWHMDILLQGVIGSAIITWMELVIGLIDRGFLHIHMWDYSNMPGNFMGIICPQFSAAWVLLSIVAVLLADMVNYYVFFTATRPHYHLLRWTFYLPERSIKYNGKEINHDSE